MRSSPKTITKLNLAVKTRQNCSLQSGSPGSKGNTDPALETSSVVWNEGGAVGIAVAGGNWNNFPAPHFDDSAVNSHVGKLESNAV